jgi:23S rRNA pseudouridine1911/1915/1917 synthase
MSRSRLQSLIRQGWVQLDGQVVAKPSLPVRGGEVVELAIPPPTPSELIPESIPLDVVFENQDLLLVNKPAGMVVHPSPGHHPGPGACFGAPDLLGMVN